MAKDYNSYAFRNRDVDNIQSRSNTANDPGDKKKKKKKEAKYGYLTYIDSGRRKKLDYHPKSDWDLNKGQMKLAKKDVKERKKEQLKDAKYNKKKASKKEKYVRDTKKPLTKKSIKQAAKDEKPLLKKGRQITKIDKKIDRKLKRGKMTDSQLNKSVGDIRRKRKEILAGQKKYKKKYGEHTAYRPQIEKIKEHGKYKYRD